MAALVTLLGVVLALLAVLVAGLLRSHAEILRALHDLGVDLEHGRPAEPRDAASHGIANPTVHATPTRTRAQRTAADVAGVTPTGDAVSVAVGGSAPLTLLAFLSSGCSTCGVFWDTFTDDVTVPGNARLVVVTKGERSESPALVRRLDPRAVPVVMSDDAWDAYDVPVAPFFVLVDGATRTVLGEGAASNWEQMTSLLQNALGDAGMLDGRGRLRRGAQARRSAEELREARADRDLLAAGITPGDPRLYRLPPSEPTGDPPEHGDPGA